MNDRLPLSILRLMLASTIASTTAAQGTWEVVDSPPSSLHAMAFDTARGLSVSFEWQTGRTREWDGAQWTLRDETGPPARTEGDVTMVYVESRNRALLFDGASGATWSWEGTAWTQRASSGPGARLSSAMSYDPRRDRVVLHGGYTLGTTRPLYLNDTWEWDGVAWTLVSVRGPLRAEHSMVDDAAAGNTLLFGGALGINQTYLDTYSWNGRLWTLLTTRGPNRSGRGRMVYDTARNMAVLVVSGGTLNNEPQTWEWNRSWRFRGAAPVIPAQGMVHDPVRGLSVFTRDGFTYGWNGTSWAVLDNASPSSSSRQRAIYDSTRETTLVVGALDGAHEWTGTSWSQVSTGVPGSTRDAAIAFDPVRNRVVLGRASSQVLNETWEWDGATWTLGNTAVANSPLDRTDYQLAFDPVSARVLLFGGRQGLNSPSDTWAWDGVTWMQVATTGPSGRTSHRMATDDARGRVVLYGGRDFPNSNVPETWEWDGTSWSLVATSGPIPRTDHAMTFDVARSRVVMHGGSAVSGGQALSGLWEWDGRAWNQANLANPVAQRLHSLTYDTTANRVFSFWGFAAPGSSANGLVQDLLRLERDVFGTGCAPSMATVPQIEVSDPRPALGTVTQFDVSSTPAAAPVFLLLGFDPLVPVLDLRSVGLPGCELLVRPVVTAQALRVGSTASVVLPIPNNPSLVGVRLVGQGVALLGGGFGLSEAALMIVR